MQINPGKNNSTHRCELNMEPPQDQVDYDEVVDFASELGQLEEFKI